MKIISPREIAEAVGLICVVGSLIFVGLEQRQNTIAIRAATNSAFATGFQELNLVGAKQIYTYVRINRLAVKGIVID